MNEKALGVVDNYELEIRKALRGRGGMVLDTDKGVKLILPATRPDRSYEREALVVEKVHEKGYELVDTFVKNKEGKIVTEDEDGHKFVIKDWYEARDCSVAEMRDVCDSVASLAKLHQVMQNMDAKEYIPPRVDTESELKAAEATYDNAQPIIHTSSIPEDYGRHSRELKMTINYLRNKKHKTEFEQTVYRSIGGFYDEARDALQLMNSPVVIKKCADARAVGEMCHGSFNYHNVAISEKGVVVANFDKYKNECHMYDLYQFMRKVMEKHDWKMELGYKMIDEYDKGKTITDEDLEVLTALFAFPEKFWKVINRYLNGSKAWIPVKNTDKLNLVIGQNQQRKEFLATVM